MIQVYIDICLPSTKSFNYFFFLHEPYTGHTPILYTSKFITFLKNIILLIAKLWEFEP